MRIGDSLQPPIESRSFYVGFVYTAKKRKEENVTVAIPLPVSASRTASGLEAASTKLKGYLEPSACSFFLFLFKFFILFRPTARASLTGTRKEKKKAWKRGVSIFCPQFGPKRFHCVPTPSIVFGSGLRGIPHKPPCLGRRKQQQQEPPRGDKKRDRPRLIRASPATIKEAKNVALLSPPSPSCRSAAAACAGGCVRGEEPACTLLGDGNYDGDGQSRPSLLSRVQPSTLRTNHRESGYSTVYD